MVTLCVVSWEKGVWCHLLLAPSKPHQEGLGRHEDVVLNQGGMQMPAHLQSSNPIRNA